MNLYLDQFINSLGRSQQIEVASILEDAIIGKSEFDTIIKQLQGLSQFTPLLLNEPNTQTFISSSDFRSNVSDISTVIERIFTESNDISLLLASLNKTLLSQAKKLEDQINALETRLENYSFLIADNNSYSYGYLESFHDNSGRDDFPWDPSDRTVLPFRSAEEALVNPVTNSLNLCNNILNPYPITPHLITGNAIALTISDTGIKNSVSSIASPGWRTEFAAAQPITSKLPGADLTGAQVLLEFNLSQPAFASQIEVVPFSDVPIELVQVMVYPSDNNEIFTNLLATPKMLAAPFTVQMPYQSVSRFRLLINQPTYTRTTTFVNIPEHQYNVLANQQNMQSPLLGGERQSRRWSYSEFFSLYWKVNSAFPGGSISRPRSFQVSRGMRLPDILRNTKTKLGPYQVWSSPTAQENTINQLFIQQKGYYKKIFHTGIASYDFLASNQEPINSKADGPAAVTAMPNPASTSLQNGFNYTYDIGLQYVAIGYASIGDKGVFISKPVDAPGSIGEVRLRVTDENVILPNTDRDSDIITSTEYSVSNASNPQKESDWVPIAPINLTSQFLVEAERFFPDSSGRGYMRFGANRVQPIKMYKNGYNINLDPTKFIYDTSNNVVMGVALPLGSFTNNDIFTITYSMSSDFSIITFPDLNKLPVTSISDSTGSGEGFSGTTGRNTVIISQEPYIDQGQVNTSTYSSQFGMTPYQPITVTLNDGTHATNLTNYTGGEQANLAMVSSGYYYIQSGTTLLFNVPVTQNFRVYYQYLQSSVRVRVVERVNYATFASPIVNSFNLKAKIIKPNPVHALGSS